MSMTIFNKGIQSSILYPLIVAAIELIFALGLGLSNTYGDTGGQSDDPQWHDGGLHFTVEELEIWCQRSKEGPYKSKGDVSKNSPGDWDNIIDAADELVRNPRIDFWKGNESGRCWKAWDNIW